MKPIPVLFEKKKTAVAAQRVMRFVPRRPSQWLRMKRGLNIRRSTKVNVSAAASAFGSAQ